MISIQFYKLTILRYIQIQHKAELISLKTQYNDSTFIDKYLKS